MRQALLNDLGSFRDLVERQPVPPLFLHPPTATTGGAADDGPDDAARARRLDWAKLLKRCFAIDVLVGPRCEAPMRLIAFIDDERTARRILDHLGLPARAPPRGRRRAGRKLLPMAVVDYISARLVAGLEVSSAEGERQT